MSTSDTLTDPREMRKAMRQGGFNASGRIDGNPSGRSTSAAVIARKALIYAERAGLSGEDAMTVLAYHALLALEEMCDREIDRLMLEPTQRFVPFVFERPEVKAP